MLGLLHSKTYDNDNFDRTDLGNCQEKQSDGCTLGSYPLGVDLGDDLDVCGHERQQQRGCFFKQDSLADRSVYDTVLSLSSLDKKRSGILSEYVYLYRDDYTCLLQCYLCA